MTVMVMVVMMMGKEERKMKMTTTRKYNGEKNWMDTSILDIHMDNMDGYNSQKTSLYLSSTTVIMLSF